jgi:glycine/D-amino acid oxidase-like deaminating enzyme
VAKNITIIGAGVVGMATASYLLRDGHNVTLVDMRPPGEYCSLGNAGILSPGSCVPFGMPGTLAKVPGYLLDPLGPLSIKPAYALRALPWLLRFIAASRRARIDPIADALRALLKQTFDAWTPLTQWAGSPEIIRRTGYLVVYESEQAFRSDALAWKIRRDRGVICEDLDSARIRELEPALRGIYRCGVFLPEQGYVTSPLRLTRSLASQFQRDGGMILQRKVLDIDVGPAGPRALATDAGALAVETLVLCAGVHSNKFSTRLGSNVPLESQRGYHVHFEHPTVTLQRPVMSGEGKFFATPMEDGLRVAGAVELGGIDAEPSYGRADALKLQAERMLPELSGSNVTQWMGHRPCMPDSLPVIGRSPRFANTYFAFGHGHVGLCGGAPTGRLIADLVAGRTPNIDLTPYRSDRF